MDLLNEALSAYPWGIYVCLLVAPFVQEDAAIIGAASSSSIGLGDPFLLFFSILIGLSASDLWKYWAGRWGRSHHKADWIAAHGKVTTVREKVVGSLGLTLMGTRFVPGTRIPIYLACGFFKAPFGPFSFWVVLSGAVYCLVAFVLFHFLGEVGGQQARSYAPLVAIGIVFTILLVQWLRGRSKKPA
jgi:membrane protein DedA with SNARE-associated domain